MTDTLDNQVAYLSGQTDATSSKSAYMAGYSVVYIGAAQIDVEYVPPAAESISAVQIDIEYVPPQKEYISSFLIMVEYQPPVRSSNDAFTSGIGFALSNKAVFLSGSISTLSSQDAFTTGVIFEISSVLAYTNGIASGTPSLSWLWLETPSILPSVTSSKSVYLEGGGNELSSSTHGYLSGQSTTTTNNPAFTSGSQSTTANQIAYLAGILGITSLATVYLEGISSLNSSFINAFSKGSTDTSSNQPCSLQGNANTLSSKTAFLQGSSNIQDNSPAFTSGGSTSQDNQTAYLEGSGSGSSSSADGYLSGQDTTATNQPAFTHGSTTVTDNQPVYLEGFTAEVYRSNKAAYLTGNRTIQYINKATGIASGTQRSLKIYKPAELQAGDLCVCFINMVLYQLDADPVGWTAPSGWQLLDTQRQQFTSSYYQRFKIYYYYATASEPTYWEWYYTSGNSHNLYGGCVFLREYDGQLQIGHRAVSIQTTSTVDNIAPAVATLRDNELVLHVGGAWGQRTRTVSGYTEVVDAYYPDSASGSALGIAYKLVSTPQTVASYTATYNTAAKNIGYHLAIRPDLLPFGIQPAYLEGGQFTSNTPAYLEGYVPKSNLPAYTQGIGVTNTSKTAFLVGGIIVASDVPAYLSGSADQSSVSAYLAGDQPYVHAYLSGVATQLNNQPAFTHGASSGSLRTRQRTYTQGYTVATPSSKSAYLYGQIFVKSSKNAIAMGYSKPTSQRCHAFISGVVRSNVHAHIVCPGNLEETMTENAFITLQTSDGGATKNVKFRVLAQDYNDGGLDKQTSMTKTIGGGMDVQMGDVYTNFNPVIRARHTEPETGYGTLGELEYFFKLVNPNSVPSNKITYIDHHGTSHTVIMHGSFQKSIMGCRIEGSEAWFLIRCQFTEVP